MSCPECGLPEVWGGMSWVSHTQKAHERRRTALYEAIRRLLDQEVRNRFLIEQAATQRLVGIRSVSGVYRGLTMWHTVTREFWDELDESVPSSKLDREWLLRHLRESASDCARWKYDVEVNPATWRQQIYAPRDRT